MYLATNYQGTVDCCDELEIVSVNSVSVHQETAQEQRHEQKNACINFLTRMEIGPNDMTWTDPYSLPFQNVKGSVFRRHHGCILRETVISAIFINHMFIPVS